MKKVPFFLHLPLLLLNQVCLCLQGLTDCCEPSAFTAHLISQFDYFSSCSGDMNGDKGVLEWSELPSLKLLISVYELMDSSWHNCTCRGRGLAPGSCGCSQDMLVMNREEFNLRNPCHFFSSLSSFSSLCLVEESTKNLGGVFHEPCEALSRCAHPFS